MASQWCTNCSEKISPDTQSCQSCAGPTGSKAVVITQDRPVILSKSQLPARQLKRLGASVAVGVVALVAEVGILYFRRRVQGVNGPLLPIGRKRPLPATTAVRVEENKGSGTRTVTVFSERIVEERRWGRPVRRIVDRLAWRSEETLDS